MNLVRIVYKPSTHTWRQTERERERAKERTQSKIYTKVGWLGFMARQHFRLFNEKSHWLFHCIFSRVRHSYIPEAGIETRLIQTPIQDSTTQPWENQHKRRKFKRLCITFVLFTYIRLTATESSIHLKSLALRLWQPLLPSLESSTPQGLGSIYIVIQWQTLLLYHNSSVWLVTLASWSWDQNPVDSIANSRFYHSTMRNACMYASIRHL